MRNPRTRWADLGIAYAVGLACGAWVAAQALTPTDTPSEGGPPAVAVGASAAAIEYPASTSTATPVPRALGAVQDAVASDGSSRGDAPSPEPPSDPPTAPPDLVASDTDAESPIVASAVGEPPVVPLARMPGSTRLSDSARFDAESSTWVLKRAFKIYARDHHVLAFYEKALRDAGLRVSRNAPPSGGMTYLSGRNDRVAAQVGIRTREGVLETRAWILWRERR